MEQAMFGEIKGDGMYIDDNQVVSKELIDEMVDQESTDVKNAIVIKTMRCQVSEILGAEITIELLE